MTQANLGTMLSADGENQSYDSRYSWLIIQSADSGPDGSIDVYIILLNSACTYFM